MPGVKFGKAAGHSALILREVVGAGERQHRQPLKRVLLLVLQPLIELRDNTIQELSK